MVGGLAIGSAARAQPSGADDPYQACLASTDADPAQALDDALAWEQAGGGNPARHCAALATLALGRPADAAQMLETLALDLAGIDAAASLALMLDAADMWLDAGAPARAEGLYAAALESAPDWPDALIGRAYALEQQGRFEAALADVIRATALAPQNAGALAVLQSALLRRLGRVRDAATLLDTAIAEAPDQADLYLERGLVRLLAGDDAGARADWQQVTTLAPESDAAGAAQANLDRLVP